MSKFRKKIIVTVISAFSMAFFTFVGAVAINEYTVRKAEPVFAPAAPTVEPSSTTHEQTPLPTPDSSFTENIISALEMRDYSEAVRLFNDEMGGVADSDLENRLSKRLSALRLDFKNESIDYAIVKAELDTISGFEIGGLSSMVSTLITFVKHKRFPSGL